jgi:uncharacterized membrane protein YtjA (UPF0391 family)
MLRWALVFLLISLVAGALGFAGLAGASAAVAKALFAFALTMFLIFLIGGLVLGRKIVGKTLAPRRTGRIPRI